MEEGGLGKEGEIKESVFEVDELDGVDAFLFVEGLQAGLDVPVWVDPTQWQLVVGTGLFLHIHLAHLSPELHKSLHKPVDLTVALITFIKLKYPLS